MGDLGQADQKGRDRAPPDQGPDQFALPSPTCLFVDAGVGPTGTTSLTVEIVTSGLEIPWALAFPAKDDILVTEMAGRLRLVRSGKLVTQPVLTLPTPGPAKDTGKGLQGIALHPNFQQNRYVYLHYTLAKGSTFVNRVARYTLSADSTTATLDRVILDDIPAGFFHNGGRMRFGPDQRLYISTGDANDPQNGSKTTTLAGKLLRLTDDGKVPADNPWPAQAMVLTGIRNSQGFDFYAKNAIYVADHGPSGEFGRSGQDEITLAAPGDNLGWPAVSGCSEAPGLLKPSLSFAGAVPPGSLLYYQGSAIPGWKGSLLMTSLGAMCLMRITFDPKNPRKVIGREVYLQGQAPSGYGRLRAMEMGPDGHLYVTTSNCDDHGSCAPPGDSILRIR